MNKNLIMRGSRKFCQGRSNFDEFFFVFFCFITWWGEEGSKYHFKRAINGPPAKRHLNGVSLAGRWWPNIECWIVSFFILRGSGPVLLRNPIFLYFFRGGRDPLSPFWTCSWPWFFYFPVLPVLPSNRPAYQVTTPTSTYYNQETTKLAFHSNDTSKDYLSII